MKEQFRARMKQCLCALMDFGWHSRTTSMRLSLIEMSGSLTIYRRGARAPKQAAFYEFHIPSRQLTTPPSQGLWCAGDHKPPLRVSGIQSGNFSGSVGSTVGQQPYREGLTVREQQETFWGWTPDQCYVEI